MSTATKTARSSGFCTSSWESAGTMITSRFFEQVAASLHQGLLVQMIGPLRTGRNKNVGLGPVGYLLRKRRRRRIAGLYIGAGFSLELSSDLVQGAAGAGRGEEHDGLAASARRIPAPTAAKAQGNQPQGTVSPDEFYHHPGRGRSGPKRQRASRAATIPAYTAVARRETPRPPPARLA